MKIISRKEAKELGLKHYFTGKPCIKGHICPKFVSNYGCIECLKITNKEWEERYPEKKRKYREKHKNHLDIKRKEWQQNNRHKTRDTSKRYYERHREKELKRHKEYKKKNPEKRRAQGQKWRKNNKEYANELSRKNQKKNYHKSNNQLRRICAKTARKLEIGKISKKKFELLGYTPEEYQDHLLKDFPQFNTVLDALQAGMHTDHIVCLAFIARHIDDKNLRFKISMDLLNLRLIPAEQNLSKNDRIDLFIVQETIKLLNEKYNVDMPLL